MISTNEKNPLQEINEFTHRCGGLTPKEPVAPDFKTGGRPHEI